MNGYHITKRAAAGLTALALVVSLLGGCAGKGGAAAVSFQKGETEPIVDTSGGGPHTAPPVAADAKEIATSGWQQLFLDDASKTVSIRGYAGGVAHWATLPSDPDTPLANAGYCAAELTAVVNGYRVALNTQDHSVAYGNAKTGPVTTDSGAVTGVQADYLLTTNAITAKKTVYAESDVAFLLHVRYTLQDGNFYVEASWENVSGNPNAFVESIGLMERFGALRNPGKNDFLMLPDGGGALLYPGRVAASPTTVETADLRFAVYGEDPASPVLEENTPALICRSAEGMVLSANVAAFGVRSGDNAFLAVVERGAALCSITAKQQIAGEADAPLQSSVGPRFLITPTTIGTNTQAGDIIYRAGQSYGGKENPDETLRISYRFFHGADNADFSTMATACREQLINIRLLSSTKTVQENSGQLPLNLILLGAGLDKNRLQTLTTFEQAQDIAARLKSKGVNSINIRYTGALSGGPKQKAPGRVRPLMRLGGGAALTALQEFCKVKGLALYPDVLAFPAGRQKAMDITGKPMHILITSSAAASRPTSLPQMQLTGAAQVPIAFRAILDRISGYNTAGISLGDIGAVLYTDAAAGQNREQAAALDSSLKQCLPSLSARWSVMMNTGYLHVVRDADVLVNLPLEPQLTMPGTRLEPRYEAAPLLPIILHGSADYSGTPLNLTKDSRDAFLRSVAFGACPAYAWSAANTLGEEDALFFETQLDGALETYTRANEVLADLRTNRIESYRVADLGVTVTRFSNEAAIYVNFNNTSKTIEGFTIPAHDFVRVG